MENKSFHGSVSTGLFTDADFLTLWLSAIPLVVIFLVSVTANGAVILMFALTVKLRKCRNTYILSLAVANFLIGWTLPISMIELLGEKWMFSDEMCTLFLTLRFSLYYVTILSIILITADRWWSVNFPFSYRIRRSKRMSLTLAILIWLLSFIIHIPTIFGWNFLHTMPVKRHSYCRVPYEYNPGFTLSASVIEFFIPLVLLISLNMGICIKLARRRNSKKIRRSLSTSEGHALYGRKLSSDIDNNNDSDEKYEIVTSLNCKDQTKINSFTVKQKKDKTGLASVTARMFSAHTSAAVRRLSLEYSQMLASVQRKCSSPKLQSRSSVSSKIKQHDDMVRDFLWRQDNKALISLVLLVITFVICWTPSTLCDIFYSFYPSAVPMWMVQVSYWALALSSSLNPFLYGIGSNDFRKVAKRWFCVKKQIRMMDNILCNQYAQPCDMITYRGDHLFDKRPRSSNVSFV